MEVTLEAVLKVVIRAFKWSVFINLIKLLFHFELLYLSFCRFFIDVSFVVKFILNYYEQNETCYVIIHGLKRDLGEHYGS